LLSSPPPLPPTASAPNALSRAGRLACLSRLFQPVARRRAYINSLYAHVERGSTPNSGYLSVSVYGRLDLQQRRFDNFKPKAEESLDDFCE